MGGGFQGKAHGLEALRASFDFSGVVSSTVTINEISYAVAVLAAVVLYRGIYQLFPIAYAYSVSILTTQHIAAFPSLPALPASW
jgi:hypothetical protein